jgi:hypothetical protein
MKQPLINILTRTSGRPKGFKICEESIKGQTYSNINHIVSYDNDKDLNYLSDCKNKIKINRSEIIKNDKSKNPNNPNFWFSPHNLYSNSLLEKVQEGWVMYLDDDDMLYDKTVVDKMVKNIIDEDTILIWKMRYPDGRCLPDSHSFKSEKIRLGGIGSPCFLFHSKYKYESVWDAYKCGDYRFLEKLYKKIPNKKWINEIFIQLNNNGGFGKKKDIKK